MWIGTLPFYELGSMIKSSIKTKLQWVRISQAWLIFFSDFEGNEKKKLVERTPTTTRSRQHLLPGPNATGSQNQKHNLCPDKVLVGLHNRNDLQKSESIPPCC